MAVGWVKSLYCKSRAYDDVYSTTLLFPISNSSCRNIKDVAIDITRTRKPRKGTPKSGSGFNPLLPQSRANSSGIITTGTEFPSLKELAEGHPSRNVVSIIFHMSWTPKVFSGRVEMIFKVQNGPRTVAHFEEYRDAVKSRARSRPRDGDDDARCVVDGNEVMRFRCLGPTSSTGGEYYPRCSSGGAWGLTGLTSSICTYSSCGLAHDNAGGRKGRRTMLVCRVIAGRVSTQQFLEDRVRLDSDSVSGDYGELVVFDHCAVLPCFLIIYRL